MKKHDPNKFYQIMYEDLEGFIEIRQMHQGRVVNRDWVKYEEMARFTQASNNDVYFGCCTRKEGFGTKEGVLELPFLWVDIDFKDIPEEEALELIEKCPLKCTAIIYSGGGIHAYWKFKEPYQVENPDDIDLIEKVLKRLASFLRADMTATDITRILRVPGTLNNKYNPPRDAYISYFSERDENVKRIQSR